MHKDPSMRRARTQEQKDFRRIEILDAAEKHFLEIGYEAFSMSSLAKLAGVVKGTLYLYFKTREEVFLTLHTRSLIRWCHVFTDQLNSGMTDHAYVSALYKTAVADGCFIPLLSRLEHVIEHNVAIESLIVSKRAFIGRVDYIAERTVPVLNITKAQASELVKTMGVLLVGATSTDRGPTLAGEPIPSDVQTLINSFSSENMFTKNACRIIAGIRADAS
ncbi:MAG: AcrR family transcriptional regulator [Candidatus Azotimanducaceae bacterium]